MRRLELVALFAGESSLAVRARVNLRQELPIPLDLSFTQEAQSTWEMEGKMRSGRWALVLVVLLCGCVSSQAVDDQQTAIAIASKACASSWGKAMKQQGGTWKVEPSEWRARLDGQVWKVWTGDEAAPILLVYVPRSGPRPTDCDLRFQD